MFIEKNTKKKLFQITLNIRFVTKNDTLALLLDFDGTLAPLASHPSLAVMEPETEIAVKTLADMSNVYLAIISGRSADDARDKVKLEITYAGNHGLEIIFANKSRYQHEIDEESFNAFEKMAADLDTSVRMLSDLFVDCCEMNRINDYSCQAMGLGSKTRNTH